MLLGFGALYFGAEWLVEGAVSIAKHLRISKVVAGVILVAFGTSAPELFVNVIAAIRSQSSFALSNVSGSNLANLLIGFGICAILVQLPVRVDQFRTDLALFAFAPFIVFIIMTFMGATLPVWTLFIFFSAFSLYLLQTRSRLREGLDDDDDDGDVLPFANSLFWFVVGCGLLYLGGESTVRQAITIGNYYGISEAILGLTVVALGTSIPDITASIVAARAGENEIATGNLLGSNIFNVLFVLPMTLLFSGIAGVGFLDASEVGVVASYGFVALFSGGFFAWVSRREELSRPLGIGLIITYFVYVIYRIILTL